MTRSLFYLIIAFIITWLLSPLYIKLLKKLKLVRQCDEDPSGVIEKRACKNGVPVMGGALVVIVITVLTLINNSHRLNTAGGPTYIPLIILLIAAVVGAIDDLLNIWGSKRRVRSLKKTWVLMKVHKSLLYRIFLFITFPWQIYKRFFWAVGSRAKGRGLFPHEKILFQVLAGGILAWWISFKLGWTFVGLPFIGGKVNIGPYLMTFLVILIVVFMANAVNFTDGLDGLSAGCLLITYSVYLFIAWQRDFSDLGVLLGATIGSLLAYLWFNVKPAKYQMGDVGSLALGAMLASIAFATDQVYLLSIFGGVFVLEIMSVILQVTWKVLFGKRLFKLTPLHHHFEYKGCQEETIVMRFWIAGIILAFLGLWLTKYL
jgi:phospho-N-acetylmuramoyl-pentapeptide-transferase